MPNEMKPIPGFTGYFASEDGEVFESREGEYRQIKKYLGDKGYWSVFAFDDQGFNRRVKVCVMVMLAFVGARPRGNDCCHSDGDRRNDKLENLRWGTPSENAADRKKHGTQCAGENHGSAKLTDAQVSQIRELRRDGSSPTELAARFNVTQSYISNLCANRKRKDS